MIASVCAACRLTAELSALIVVAALLPGGCAWDTANQVGSGDFNTALLNRGGLIIGGVSSKDALLPDETRLAFGALMSDAFEAQFPRLAVVRTDTVYEALGRWVFSQMLDSYRFHGNASTVFMNRLNESFPRTRYVAFARVERSQVERGRRMLESGSGVELQTSRAVIVGMRVYDLHDRRTMVWAAALQGAEANRRRLLSAPAGEVSESLYPEPPSTEAALMGVLDRLAAYVAGRK